MKKISKRLLAIIGVTSILVQCAMSVDIQNLQYVEMLTLYKNETLSTDPNSVYFLINCRDSHLEQDEMCVEIKKEIDKSVQKMSETEKKQVEERYKFRYVNCDKEFYKLLCEKQEFYNDRKGIIRFVLPDQQDIYYFSSPYQSEFFGLKILKMIEKEDITVVNGKFQDLISHPIATQYKRSIIVLESQNPKIIDYFQQWAKYRRESTWTFQVLQSNPLEEHKKPDFDNIYIIGPRNQVEIKYLPNSEMQAMMAASEIKNIFRMHSQPPGIINIRSMLLSHKPFQEKMDGITIYVAVVDSFADDFQQEFYYQYRDWIQKFSEQELKQRKIAFAVLDWSFHDKRSPEAFEKLDMTYRDQPTIIAIKDIKNGIYYKQDKKYNGENFKEISQGFMKKVEKEQVLPLSTEWSGYHLNLMNPLYWKTFTFYQFVRDFFDLQI